VNSAWKPPVVISRQSSTTFSDKEQIWADNASSSPFFGTTYVCWAAFVGQEKGNAAPAPLQVAVSHDGGDNWRQHQISAAANNSQRNPTDGCTIRTDSHGNAYVFGVGTVPSAGNQAFELMSVSRNGGATWSRPAPVAGPVTQPGAFDPGARPARHRRRRWRPQRPGSGAECRHRERCPDRCGRDEPDRDELRQRGPWRHRTCTSPSPPTGAPPGRPRRGAAMTPQPTSDRTHPCLRPSRHRCLGLAPPTLGPGQGRQP
jgi:hypothetical protein